MNDFIDCLSDLTQVFNWIAIAALFFWGAVGLFILGIMNHWF